SAPAASKICEYLGDQSCPLRVSNRTPAGPRLARGPRADSCSGAPLRLQEVRQSRRITIRTEAAVAASASGRKLAPYPAEGGSLWIERVAVRTPGHRLPCIAR